MKLLKKTPPNTIRFSNRPNHPLFKSPPALHEINACRAALFTAATHEISANANGGTSYDPITDQRFIWAVQWLEVAEGSRNRIEPGVESCCFLLTSESYQSSLSRQHLAANDIS